MQLHRVQVNHFNIKLAIKNVPPALPTLELAKAVQVPIGM
jgi:hypothetical protein